MARLTLLPSRSDKRGQKKRRRSVGLERLRILIRERLVGSGELDPRVLRVPHFFLHKQAFTYVFAAVVCPGKSCRAYVPPTDVALPFAVRTSAHSHSSLSLGGH